MAASGDSNDKILLSNNNRLPESNQIAFALVNLFHVKIQEPASRSTTTRAFVFLAKFTITKYLKQEVDDNLRVCVDECSPCVISITEDIKMRSKSNDIITPNGAVSYGLLSRNCLYCTNLITVATVTRDKDICQSHVNTVFPLTSDGSQIDIAPLGIHSEITSSPLMTAAPLNAVLLRIAALFYK